MVAIESVRPADSRRLAAVPDVPGVLRVRVVGADPAERARLVALLAGTPGIEVVGWAEPEPECGRAYGPDSARPRLSARQREVLAAYSSSNDLLSVVARGLGMAPETVKTHLRRIRCKYEDAGRPAPTRRDLYVRAVEDGLLLSPMDAASRPVRVADVDEALYPKDYLLSSVPH